MFLTLTSFIRPLFSDTAAFPDLSNSLGENNVVTTNQTQVVIKHQNYNFYHFKTSKNLTSKYAEMYSATITSLHQSKLSSFTV